MLGRTVSDPERVEAAGAHGDQRGMGLLEMDTECSAGEKVQTPDGEAIFSGVEGNARRPERTAPTRGTRSTWAAARQQMPALAGSGNVYGSYVHGIFGAPGIADDDPEGDSARGKRRGL